MSYKDLRGPDFKVGAERVLRSGEGKGDTFRQRVMWPGNWHESLSLTLSPPPTVALRVLGFRIQEALLLLELRKRPQAGLALHLKFHLGNPSLAPDERGGTEP